MTNNEIILAETIDLIHNGIITEEECIHTYERWIALGYQVQRGEKAITYIKVWKPITRKRKKDGIEENKLILANSAFFASSQVKPIAD